MSSVTEDAMTDDDLAALIAEAEKATPGPWVAHYTSGRDEGGNCFEPAEAWVLGPSGQCIAAWNESYPGFFGTRRCDQQFMSAANPSVIIALATELRAARKALAAVEKVCADMDACAGFAERASINDSGFPSAHRFEAIAQQCREDARDVRAALALANPEVKGLT